MYLDESGTHGEASHFVLAGLAVFEREIHWFSQAFDLLQEQYFPEETEPVFFHAARLTVRSGDKVEPPWDRLDSEKRRELKTRVLDIIRTRRGVLFGCAIEKEYARIRHEDAYELAFEDLVSRFDLYLSRINRVAVAEGKEEQRGLVVLAESSFKKTIALLGQRMNVQGGTRWGSLHNIADVPLFAPARDTRLLQYADFCAHAIYGRYHSKLIGDFDRIAGKFDIEGPAIHGLVHRSLDSGCSCLACFSRRGRQPALPSL
ncbi:MAG: DUF3800 domain-containing protein [Chloroflexota bacterium]